MFYNRLIPCLLLDYTKLVKTTKFQKPRYIGDPLNAVRIFNDREADELIFIDIKATKEHRKPDFTYLAKIAEQCFMPLCYAGGIETIEDIKKLFKIGFEKVAINYAAYMNPELVKKAVSIFGSQSIVGAIDVDSSRKDYVKILGGKINTKQHAVDYAKQLERLGVGELFINIINRDGTMQGYDLEIIRQISRSVGIPVIACGGAGSLEDCKNVIAAGASAAAAGSIFVYWGRKNAILVNYPDQEEIHQI